MFAPIPIPDDDNVMINVSGKHSTRLKATRELESGRVCLQELRPIELPCSSLLRHDKRTFNTAISKWGKI